MVTNLTGARRDSLPLRKTWSPATGRGDHVAATRDDMLKIGEVARLVGLSLRTVRYYEEVGLVAPSGRTEGHFRLYTEGDVGVLRVVKSLKPLGFSLDEMRDLLGVRARVAGGHASQRTIDRLEMYATLCRERCDKLRMQLEQAEGLASGLADDVRRARRTSR
jgi:MerR family transcriptional regulator, copper efflux regulator